MPKRNNPRLLRLMAALTALLLCLTGCSGGNSAGSSFSEYSYAQSLYTSRVATVEDSAGLNSLFAQLGLESRMGPFTTELEQDGATNTLTLKFEQAPEDSTVFKDQFEYYAVLILALVDDCGQVRGTFPSSDGADSHSLEWNIQQANDHLNVNVDFSGHSADGIAALLDTIRSTHSDNANFAALYEDA